MQTANAPAQAAIAALDTVTIVDIAREMIRARAIADELLEIGLDQAAQYSYDDAAMDAAEIRRRLANLSEAPR